MGYPHLCTGSTRGHCLWKPVTFSTSPVRHLHGQGECEGDMGAWGWGRQPPRTTQHGQGTCTLLAELSQPARTRVPPRAHPAAPSVAPCWPGRAGTRRKPSQGTAGIVALAPLATGLYQAGLGRRSMCQCELPRPPILAHRSLTPLQGAEFCWCLSWFWVAGRECSTGMHQHLLGQGDLCCHMAAVPCGHPGQAMGTHQRGGHSPPAAW